MSEELTQYEGKTPAKKMNIDEIARLSDMFHKSGMFKDVTGAAQIAVKIQAGYELGLEPFQSINGIHIIQGRPAIGAGLMAAKLDSHSEYDFKVTEHDDKICSIDFYKNGDLKGTSTFTIDDARKAGTKNLDKFPKNMLYARALSNGVKWYTPGLFNGSVYVPEEFEQESASDFIDAIKTQISEIDSIENLNEHWRGLSKTQTRSKEIQNLYKLRKIEIQEGGQND